MKQSILLLSLVWLISSCTYLPTEETIAPEDVTVEETSDYYALVPTDSVKTDAILFIPGGLVDPHAYTSLLRPFAMNNNVLVVIPKVRSNLAITNQSAVLKVRNQFSGHRWILGGHSLGGTVASYCIESRPTEWVAFFLLGSYSTVDLNLYSEPILNMRGSEDALTTADNWSDNADYLPAGYYVDQVASIPNSETRRRTIYYTVLGGNHAQWGNYGVQAGDGTATISMEDQQLQFYNALLKILRNNGINI